MQNTIFQSHDCIEFHLESNVGVPYGVDVKLLGGLAVRLAGSNTFNALYVTDGAIRILSPGSSYFI